MGTGSLHDNQRHTSTLFSTGSCGRATPQSMLHTTSPQTRLHLYQWSFDVRARDNRSQSPADGTNTADVKLRRRSDISRVPESISRETLPLPDSECLQPPVKLPSNVFCRGAHHDFSAPASMLPPRDLSRLPPPLYTRCHSREVFTPLIWKRLSAPRSIRT